MKVFVTPDIGGKNPYIRLLTTTLQEHGVDAVDFKHTRRFFPLLADVHEHGQPDVIHLQWQHPLLISKGKPLKSLALTLHFYLQFIILRLLGVRFVWTVHNITNHEGNQAVWELWNCRLLARLVDRMVVHCPAAVSAVSQAYRVSKESIRVVPLGNYREWYRTSISQQEARRSLQLPVDAKLLLFFGGIRPYKGVENLLDTFREISDDRSILLAVGNPTTKQLASTLREKAAQDSRIILNLEWVEEEVLIRYLCAADIVILPYLDVLTSSAVNLAAALGKCCIIPKIGCMADFPDDAVIFYSPDEVDDLKTAINRSLLLTSEERGYIGFQAKNYVEQFSWAVVGHETLSVYKEVVGTTRE